MSFQQGKDSNMRLSLESTTQNDIQKGKAPQGHSRERSKKEKKHLKG